MAPRRRVRATRWSRRDLYGLFTPSWPRTLFSYERTPSAGEAGCGSPSTATREGTRTPEKHEHPSQGHQAFSVEVLTAYSHTTQAADLPISVLAATRCRRPETKSTTMTPWSLRERLSDDVIRAMAYAYRAGATARDLAVAHDLSLSSVKRLLRIAGVRRTPPARQSEIATSASTRP
jgi:hypothetical protein